MKNEAQHRVKTQLGKTFSERKADDDKKNKQEGYTMSHLFVLSRNK